MNVPRELLRSVPRSVELTLTGRIVFALTFLLAVGAFTAATLLCLQSIRTEERVEVRKKEGTTTTGVLQAATRRKDDWRLTYSFEANGHTIEGHSGGRKIEPGTQVTVGYLPADAKDNWLVGREPKATPYWVGPLMGFFLLAMTGLIQFKLRRQKYLLENGRGAIAVAMESKRVSDGKTVAYSIRFEYRQPSGSVATGKLKVDKDIPVGTEFVIVYDPDQPKRVSKYPTRLYRIVE